MLRGVSRECSVGAARATKRKNGVGHGCRPAPLCPPRPRPSLRPLLLSSTLLGKTSHRALAGHSPASARRVLTAHSPASDATLHYAPPRHAMTYYALPCASTPCYAVPTRGVAAEPRAPLVAYPLSPLYSSPPLLSGASSWGPQKPPLYSSPPSLSGASSWDALKNG